MLHFTYEAEIVCEIVGGKMIQHSGTAYLIKQLLIDSRKLLNPAETIFFALVTERNDGHRYIGNLYQQGVRNFIISDKTFKPEEYFGANFILVEDTLKALQELASCHRLNFKIPVIGITGSNGKTIVKEWLFQLLKDKFNIVRSPKSFNSQIGVPLSVWQLNSDHQLAIFEAGISCPGEMQRLEAIIKPEIGLITNIGDAHSENFKDLTEKIDEKLKLFSSAKKLIYCRDYETLHQRIKDNQQLNDVEKICWSKKGNANLLISRVEQGEHDTLIQGIYKNDFLKITIPFIDTASIENAISCWLLMLELQLSNDFIAEQMAHLSPVAMRLELKEGISNCSIINDSYNSDLGSLAIAIDFLKQQNQHQKKTLILSDILQSNKDDVAIYKQVSHILKSKGINRLIGVGSFISKNQNLFEGEKYFFESTEELLKNMARFNFNNETILLKGARAFGFERISKLLQQKAHETILEINLTALINNLNYYKSLLQPQTKLMAMVKAFSYGSGSFEIANVLQFNNVDYLAVAYTDEGVELRKAGITVPIMVMNPEPQSFEAMLAYNLEPDVYSFRVLNQLCECLDLMGENKTLSIHIELDTGMHRLGFERNDINELIVRLKNKKNIIVKSVFSHFVGSEEHALDFYTHKQIKEFNELSGDIISHYSYPVLRHICNSSAISRFQEAQFDMVRLGIGLYGISSYDYEQNKLQQVGTLRSIISQIRNIKGNDTVGYNRKGVVKNDSRIATIPIGYADGLSRRLSNGKGKFYVNGHFAPIVGNVCMDMVMIDVTNIPCDEGEEVIIFGEKNPIANIAEAADTIPYEILTSISRRVKRIYYQE